MKFSEHMNNEDLLNQIVRLMQTDDSADAPAEAVKWTKNIFRTRVVEQPKSLVKKVLAVLQIDLAPNKAAFGERSASAGSARQLLFDAGEHQIDLRITGVNKGFRLNGQVLGAGFAGAEVKLFNAEKSLTVNSNDLSEFSFEKISKGTYTLSLTFVDKEIIIENIIIG
jgi:hypothetical protein